MRYMERERIKRGMCGILLAVCMAVFLCGCQIGSMQIVVSGTIGNKQVFKIGGRNCGLKEARVYLTNYQNIYGTAYTIDLWQHDFGDDSLVTYVKDLTLDELTRVYCMALLAESRGIALSEEEAGKVSEAAKEYYVSLSQEERDYLSVSEIEIKEYYGRYALSQKLYNSLTSEVDEEVSDDEARVMEIMQIYVEDADKAAEVARKLSDGDDFAAVANNYNRLPAIQVTVSRDDLLQEVEDVVFQMDNGEISGMIPVENGYYFIKCLNKYNEELTQANKSNIVEKREKEAFDDVYNEFVSSLHSYINEDLWEELEMDTSGMIRTGSFFEIFYKYCSDI